MKFPIFFLVIVLFSGIFCVNAFAQCDGIFFKTANREIYASTPVANFAFEYSPVMSRQADITGDGKIDLIGGSILNHEIYIAPGEDNGNFGALITVSIPQPSYFYVEDFTGDGLKDLLVETITSTSNFTSYYRIYRNDGNGTSFTPLAQTDGIGTIRNIVDINNDHRADLILDNSRRFANADGTFAAPVNTNSFEYFQFQLDFNNDGFKDFAYIRDSVNLGIVYNNGDGTFTFGPALTAIGTNAKIEGVTDFNNDGKPDILARNNSQVFFYISRPAGGYIESFYSINLPTASLYLIQDFTGDGFKDVLIKYAPTLYSPMNPIKPAVVLTNNGAGVFTASNTEIPVRDFSLGDLDGDSKADLLIFNNNAFAGTIGGGMFLGETQIHFQKNVCSNPPRTKTVDYDGDNITERTFFRPTDGRWRYRKSTDNSIVNFNWGLNGDIPQSGDFDGDRKTDIAVYRPSNGVWYISNSSNGAYTILKFGTAEDKPVASDFNGDGRTDIAVFRPSDGNWYIYFLDSGQYAITHFGADGDKPVPEDFDGDGKTDLAVYRPSTGVWYYLKSSDANFGAVRWGNDSDTPIPADYDGDGRADFMVFRASDNKWYILKSSDSNFLIFRFGTTGDTPQVSDWDGNGTADLGVYRTSTKLWYSTINDLSTSFGETDEMPVSSILRTE